jgi:hypothetical protein
VLRLERRITREGMISVDGNLYSVPNTAHRRAVEVHSTASEIRILEAGQVIAVHPVLDGRGQRRIIARHRTLPPPANRDLTRNAQKPHTPNTVATGTSIPRGKSGPALAPKIRLSTQIRFRPNRDASIREKSPHIVGQNASLQRNQAGTVDRDRSGPICARVLAAASRRDQANAVLFAGHERERTVARQHVLPWQDTNRCHFSLG